VSVLHLVSIVSIVLAACVSYVVCNGDSSQIGEEGDEDDEVSADGLVDDDHL